jgi:hypothetical protein
MSNRAQKKRAQQERKAAAAGAPTAPPNAKPADALLLQPKPSKKDAGAQKKRASKAAAEPSKKDAGAQKKRAPKAAAEPSKKDAKAQKKIAQLNQRMADPSLTDEKRERLNAELQKRQQRLADDKEGPSLNQRRKAQRAAKQQQQEQEQKQQAEAGGAAASPDQPHAASPDANQPHAAPNHAPTERSRLARAASFAGGVVKGTAKVGLSAAGATANAGMGASQGLFAVGERVQGAGTDLANFASQIRPQGTITPGQSRISRSSSGNNNTAGTVAQSYGLGGVSASGFNGAEYEAWKAEQKSQGKLK